MNRAFLPKNIGKSLRLYPEPIHVSESGEQSTPCDDWILVDYSGRIATLRHAATGALVALGDDHIRDYRTDVTRGEQFGSLVLLAKLVVRGEQIEVIPLTHPGQPFSLAPGTLLGEAYLEASLECHAWKIAFMHIYGPDLREPAASAIDVWDALEVSIPEYSAEAFQVYAPVFGHPIAVLRSRLDRVVHLFGHCLPEDFQVQLLRANRQLMVEAESYAALQSLLRIATNVDPNVMFRGRFLGVIRVLKGISREADRRRETIAKGRAIS